MMQTLTIPGRLPGEREFRRMSQDERSALLDRVGWLVKGANLSPCRYGASITVSFYERREGCMRDKSDIADLAIRVINRALVEHRVINTGSYQAAFYETKDNPRIEVAIDNA